MTSILTRCITRMFAVMRSKWANGKPPFTLISATAWVPYHTRPERDVARRTPSVKGVACA